MKRLIKREIRSSVLLCLLALGPLLAAPASGAAEQAIGRPPEQALKQPPAGIQAFHPGETLVYDVSWSGMFSAGTVTMTVEAEPLPDGRGGLKFVVQGRTHGLMDKFFPVNDSVLSVFDPRLMQSISYALKESFGKKKRLRVTEFDHAKRTALCRMNEDPPETVATPDPVQDGLSLLYVLRAQEGLATGRNMDVAVVDTGKNWTMEVAVLEREKVRTAAGEFDTIKVRLTPKDAEGVRKKREVLVWMTDDGRRVPVLMKSELKVGSFVFELSNLKQGIHAFTQ